MGNYTLLQYVGQEYNPNPTLYLVYTTAIQLPPSSYTRETDYKPRARAESSRRRCHKGVLGDGRVRLAEYTVPSPSPPLIP